MEKKEYLKPSIDFEEIELQDILLQSPFGDYDPNNKDADVWYF